MVIDLKIITYTLDLAHEKLVNIIFRLAWSWDQYSLNHACQPNLEMAIYVLKSAKANDLMP